MKRRAFLEGIGAAMLAVAGVGIPACKRAAPRQEVVLGALVSEVVTAQLGEVSARCHELAAMTKTLVASPSPDSLHQTRASWKRAALAWKRASAFSVGPLVESGVLAQVSYFPVRPAAIDGLVSDDRAIGPEFVQDLGTDLKGIYALEHLLFDGKMPAPARVSGPGGDRARRLVEAFALELATAADGLVKAIGKGNSGYAKTFADAGHESVARLVNQMIESTESLVESRLSTVLWMDKVHRLEPKDVEGYASGTSNELAMALVVGLQRVYHGGTGGGLADLTKTLSPSLSERVTRAFDQAVLRLRDLKKPLEVAVVEERATLEGAVSALKALEISLKTELATALAVTLTFTSHDND